MERRVTAWAGTLVPRQGRDDHFASRASSTSTLYE